MSDFFARSCSVKFDFVEKAEGGRPIFEHKIRLLRTTHVQSGASYLSQDFVMFFYVSCEGQPGQ